MKENFIKVLFKVREFMKHFSVVQNIQECLKKINLRVKVFLFFKMVLNMKVNLMKIYLKERVEFIILIMMNILDNFSKANVRD